MSTEHTGKGVSEDRNLEAAKKILRESTAATGTPVETYLNGIGLTLPPPRSLLSHKRLRHGLSHSNWPAMVARINDGAAGAQLGIHRTFLTSDGSAKAAIEPNPMLLGPCRGGAVFLADANTEGALIIGEGIETCLAVMQATKIPVWATLTHIGLHNLNLHSDIRDIIILGSEDKHQAIRRAVARRWMAEGRRVRMAILPEPDMDLCRLLIKPGCEGLGRADGHD